MAMRITPGYDFGVNEVPTKAHLLLAAAGMSLTSIAAAQISGTLIGFRYESSTSASFPAEGWVNVDELNRVWVMTRFGKAQVYRAGNQGWETRRYKTGVPIDHWSLPQSIIVPIGELRTVNTGDSNEANVVYKIGTNLVGRHVFKNNDTCVSGAYTRLVGRGFSMGAPFTSNRLTWPDYFYRHSSEQEDFPIAACPATSENENTLGRKQGMACKQGFGSVNAVCYYFGMEMFQD